MRPCWFDRALALALAIGSPAVAAHAMAAPAVTALAVAALAVAAPAVAAPSARCDRVVSYFTDFADSSGARQVQWRVLDPHSGRDTLVLAIDDLPTGVRWDSAYARVEFAANGAIQRMAWAPGARPRSLATLPAVAGIEDWWFNPARSCWQAAATRALSMRTEATTLSAGCVFELWSTSQDGARWTLERADTTEGEPDGGCDWPWGGDPACARAPMVALDQLETEMGPEYWREEAVTPPRGEDDEDSLPGAHWCFIPSRTSPRRGIELRVFESDETLGLGPLYWVDRGRGEHRLICDRIGLMRQTLEPVRLREECGRLLVTTFEHAYLVDLASGRELTRFPHPEEGCAWVGRPRAKAAPGR